jgi:hypothetical protein
MFQHSVLLYPDTVDDQISFSADTMSQVPWVEPGMILYFVLEAFSLADLRAIRSLRVITAALLKRLTHQLNSTLASVAPSSQSSWCCCGDMEAASHVLEAVETRLADCNRQFAAGGGAVVPEKRKRRPVWGYLTCKYYVLTSIRASA